MRPMAFPFMRAPRPTARQIIDAAMEQRDFKTASIFLLAGAAEIVAESRQHVEATATGRDTFARTLRAATAALAAD
jgi:hypothetical protein